LYGLLPWRFSGESVASQELRRLHGSRMPGDQVACGKGKAMRRIAVCAARVDRL